MLEELLKEIKKLQEAKALLDTILSKYDMFTMEFVFHSEQDIEKIKKRINPNLYSSFKTDKQLLYEAIREYQDIDDSE